MEKKNFYASKYIYKKDKRSTEWERIFVNPIPDERLYITYM